MLEERSASPWRGSAQEHSDAAMLLFLRVGRSVGAMLARLMPLAEGDYPLCVLCRMCAITAKRKRARAGAAWMRRRLRGALYSWSLGA
jgi:hypothetical protein